MTHVPKMKGWFVFYVKGEGTVNVQNERLDSV